MMAPTESLWSGNSKHNDLYNALRKLIPISGSVEKHHTNPALEKFRKACNCYYDLYNNGLGNRAGQFVKIFNIPKHDATDNYIVGQRARDVIEQRMINMMMKAAIEQEIIQVDSYTIV